MSRALPPFSEDTAKHMTNLRLSVTIAHHGIGAILEHWNELTASQVYDRLLLLHDETKHARIGDRRRPEKGKRRPPVRSTDSAAIRAWGLERGLIHTTRGRMPQAVIDAYRAEQEEAA